MLKKLISVTALKFIGLFGSFAILLILSRFHGASAVGGYSLLMSILGLGSLTVGFGMPESILRDSAAWYAKSQINEIAKECNRLFVVCILNSLAFWCFLPYIFSFYKSDQNLAFLLSAQGVIILTTFSMALSYIFANVFRGINSVKMGMFLRETMSPLLTLILVAVLSVYYYYRDDSAQVNMTILVFVVASLVLLVSLFYYHKKIGFGLSPINFKGLHRYWLKSIPFVLLSIVVWGNNSLDIMMLGAITSAEETGRYTISARLSAMIGLIIIISNTILAPRLTQFYASGKIEEFKQLAIKSTFYLGICAVLAFLAALVFGRAALILFGEAFANDHTLLLILCFAQAINVIVGPVGYIIIAARKEKIMGTYSMLALALNVVLNYVFIQSYQAIGAALATSISLILLNLFCLLYIKIQLGFFTTAAWSSWQTTKLYILDSKQQICGLLGKGEAMR